jgi:HCOMODA/2-hydroxy-3-carboxy-muconic semialdehyde decarboxylase
VTVGSDRSRAIAGDVVSAARVLARHGLVDAFGHISARVAENVAYITPAVPLASTTATNQLLELAIDAADLPADMPGEAWIHTAIYSRRPGVGAVCRAQPAAVAAAVAAGLEILPLHGQGSLVGVPVPVHADAMLVRDAARGRAVAAALGDQTAVALRGNGAVTVGSTVGEATARMYLLEASARLNLQAAAAGSREAVSAGEIAFWESVSSEILTRLWTHLSTEP